MFHVAVFYLVVFQKAVLWVLCVAGGSVPNSNAPDGIV